MMNIAWTFTPAIVIFAAQRYALGVEPMCSSPYSAECVEDDSLLKKSALNRK
jgi:hypothetical protein